MCCRKNRLMISEQETVYIKNLYGLLTEDVKTDPNQVTIEFEEKFPGSKYANLTEKGKTELENKLNEAKDWLVKNKGSLIFVLVEAGESRIKNYDREQDPPVEVPEGYLSKKRAKTLKRELNTYFKTLVDQKVLPEMPIFEPPKVVIGESPVSATLQPLPSIPASKYSAEQYTKVYLKLMMPEKCLMDVDIAVAYYKDPKEGYPCRGGHQCDAANFEVRLNGVPIGNANLNNAKDGASKRSPRLVITQDIASKVISKDRRKLVLSLKCLSGGECHSGTPEIEIRKNNQLIWDRCSPAMARGDQGDIEILEIDPCGNVTEMGKGDGTNKDEVAKTNKVEAKPTGFTINVPSDYEFDDSKFIEQIAANQLLSEKTGQVNNELFLRGFNKTTLEWVSSPIGWKTGTGNFSVPESGISYRRKNLPKGILNVDPGTIITKIIGKDKPNNNPPEGFTLNGLNIDDETSSRKYHVVDEGGKPVLSPGQSTKKLEAEKAAGIVRFNLDDDAIEDFEDFFMTKNKLVTKSPNGIYTVTANSINYGGKPYKKGSKLKLDT